MRATSVLPDGGARRHIDVENLVVRDVRPASICRCGAFHDLGIVSVEFGDLTVAVTITRDGAKLPTHVKFNRADPAAWEVVQHAIEKAWAERLVAGWEIRREVRR